VTKTRQTILSEPLWSLFDLSVASQLLAWLAALRHRSLRDNDDLLPYSQIGGADMRNDSEAEIAEFIRKKGVARCPTAFAHQTHGTLSPEDQQQLRLTSSRWL
jgi:hypothetical protein